MIIGAIYLLIYPFFLSLYFRTRIILGMIIGNFFCESCKTLLWTWELLVLSSSVLIRFWLIKKSKLVYYVKWGDLNSWTPYHHSNPYVFPPNHLMILRWLLELVPLKWEEIKVSNINPKKIKVNNILTYIHDLLCIYL